MHKDRKTLLDKIKIYWEKIDIPNVSEELWNLLALLVKTGWYKSGLEIWTANWYSAIWLWDAFEANWWKLITYELSTISYALSTQNIKDTKLEKVVDLRVGDYREMSEDSFDFVFIDARKSEYLDYLKFSLDRIQDGGLIIVDNIIKFKKKMPEFYEYVEKHLKDRHFVLPIQDWKDDGIMVIEA